MPREWATTEGKLEEKVPDGTVDSPKRILESPKPVPPTSADSWSLRGAIEHRGRVLWFWERAW